MTQRHWSVWCWQLGWVGLLGWIGAIAFASSTLAQSRIVPDNTLGAESSIVTRNFLGLPVEAITGGAIRGVNLFHSFREFNVDNGRAAYFQNPNASIKNIFARVTGNVRSDIFGTLGTIGNAANLFLINPNGIVFGSNARLDVGGSFVGTTANAIQFGNSGIFSASTPDIPSPLLTINPSALLFNQLSPASITNNSIAPAGLNPAGVQVIGLRVPDGQSLLLVGGDVNVDHGSLRAYQGRVELAGLAAPGTVGLNLAENTLSLNVPVGVARANVFLTNGAEVNVRGANGGSIVINAHDLNLAGVSKLIAGIDSGLGTPNSQAGDIEINATGSLSLSNGSYLNTNALGQGDAGKVFVQASGAVSLDNSFILSNVGARAVGNSGGIFITAESLSLFDGAQIQSGTSAGGRGNPGGVNINVGDRVTLSRVNQNRFFSGIYNNTEAGSVGNGGDINISARSLSLTDGTFLNTSNAGQGNGGNITIDARDTVKFVGIGVNSIGGLETNIQPGGVGKGGDIRVTTGSLSLTNSSILFAGNAGQGNAGNITINARDAITFDGTRSIASTEIGEYNVGNGGNIRVNTKALFLKNGAQIRASTSGIGDGGNVTINANTFEALNGGQVVTSTAGTGNAGTIHLNLKDSLTLAGSNVNFTSQRPSGIFANTDSGSTGLGGSIFIDPRQATIRDGATISVNSNGTGKAGNINLLAGTLTLENGGSISAETKSSQGGNINLPLGNILLLRRGSNISTNAQAGGDGGNIKINAPFIVAVPDENSDITANAYSGSGGRVKINAQGLIGIQFRSQLTSESDITANSTLGVGGVVNISTSDPNILRDNLTQLPENIIDANTLVANSCIARRHNQSGGTFFVIGNGGLPERPGEATLSRYSTGTIRTIPNEGEKAALPTSTNSVRPWKTGDPIIAAQGIYRLANGDLVLGRECPLAESY